MWAASSPHVLLLLLQQSVFAFSLSLSPSPHRHTKYHIRLNFLLGGGALQIHTVAKIIWLGYVLHGRYVKMPRVLARAVDQIGFILFLAHTIALPVVGEPPRWWLRLPFLHPNAAATAAATAAAAAGAFVVCFDELGHLILTQSKTRLEGRKKSKNKNLVQFVNPNFL